MSPNHHYSGPFVLSCLLACCITGVLLVGLPVPAAQAAEAACPNQAVREEQPHAVSLPDCRAYEQVTPGGEGKQGQDAKGAPNKVRSSPGRPGETLRFEYYSISPFEGASSVRGSFPTYISSREEDGSWATKGVLPFESPYAYVEGFDEDLTESVVMAEEVGPEGTSLDGAVGYYLRNSVTGSYSLMFLGGDYDFILGGFSEDGSRLAFEDSNHLAPEAIEGKFNAYEYDTNKPAEQRLSLVGFVPRAGETSCTGPGCEVPAEGSSVGAGARSNGAAYSQGAISQDGSVVFFTARPSGRLYARLVEDDETIAVSAGTAQFLQATPDGAYVFYTEERSEGTDLYRFDTASGQREALTATTTGTGILSAGSKEVSDVSTASGAFFPGQHISGTGIPSSTSIAAVGSGTLMLSAAATVNAAGVALTAGAPKVNGLLGVSDDGTYAYFAAEGLLAGNIRTTTVTGEGTLTSGSSEVTALSTDPTSDFFAPGQEISGPGIPAHTIITAVTLTGITPTGLTLSNRATESANNASLTAIGKEGAAEESGLTTNLYEWHENSEAHPSTTFVSGLSTEGRSGVESDSDDWRDELVGTQEGKTMHTARVSPDGTTLLFSSTMSLTGYLSHTEAGCESQRSEVCAEFFRYRAGEDGSPASLKCVSCNPSDSEANVSASLVGEGGGGITSSEAFLTRNLSENGDRVFFENQEPLLAHENAGGVYEWEAVGEGSCTSESEDGGCLYQLAGDGAYLGGASTNGNDVFFFTREPLNPSTDTDNNVDVYDARVDGGKAAHQCEPAVEKCEEPTCESAEACKPPLAEPPVESYPATATFSGPGNLIPPLESPVLLPKAKPALKKLKCAKGKHRSHGRCVKTKTKRTRRKSKKASANSRSGR